MSFSTSCQNCQKSVQQQESVFMKRQRQFNEGWVIFSVIKLTVNLELFIVVLEAHKEERLTLSLTF